MPAAPAKAVHKADLIEGFITGLSAINAFTDASPRLTATELADKLDISRAAARRFLITLNHVGYAATDGRTYWLTPRVLALGHSYFSSARLPRTARPFLQQIATETQESSNLALLEGRDVIYVARANVARLMSTGIEPGTRLPAHTTAAGRVILAGLTKAEFDTWLANAELAAYTPQTVVNKKKFAAEVNATRAAGYSAVESQFEIGLRGIAVPLASRRGDIVGALGVSMASSTCGVKEATLRCMPALKAAAQGLMDLI